MCMCCNLARLVSDINHTHCHCYGDSEFVCRATTGIHTCMYWNIAFFIPQIYIEVHMNDIHDITSGQLYHYSVGAQFSHKYNLI